MVQLNKNQAFNSTQQQANNQFTENQSQFQEQSAPNQTNQSKGLFSLPPSLMQIVPWIPFFLEATTGQKIPAIGGTIGEIQNSLVQIQASQAQLLNNQNQIWTKLNSLENSASNQLTNLSQQVKSIHSLRLTHSRESKEVEIMNNPHSQSIPES